MDYLKQPMPQVGTWVCKQGNKERGVVEKIEREFSSSKVLVRWLQSRRIEWLSPDVLCNGFPLGIEVQDVPASRARTPLGEGIVREVRQLGLRDQVLVEFPETGELHWLPFQNLKQIKGVRQRFILGHTGSADNAERCRMRCLAHAIEMWHENTGSLSRLDIDPLPHQIHLVHHILASGNLNWLIADDVGLGKTIEVGMLLSALIRRGNFHRILLVTPAGLVNQWKEELHYKFGLNDFQVYGEDFNINEVRHWKLYDHVIGSVDRLKSDAHMEKLMYAEPWDMVIFDEAHRLSRFQVGVHFKSSDRFRLAAALRKKTDAMILLTATPHQGKQDKFQALLELLRPELEQNIRALSINPDILRQMVIRNTKADVTDGDGKFIFSGKITSTVQVTLTGQEKAFDKDIQNYFRQGYAAGSRRGGAAGRAIGFVMSIYRKLSASSIAAIKNALERRLQRLMKDGAKTYDSYISEPEDAIDERFHGEWEEAFHVSEKQFFEGEERLLRELIKKTRDLLLIDSKLRLFLDELIPQIIEKNSSERILIFTEYKSTQSYLAEALGNKFGKDRIFLIHGGMGHEERAAAIADFEEYGQFLISTEAGGEGINLHRQCHIMVNYDLPWNPMRLVQRVGRLYRYGQKKKVIVFNINVPHTMDGDLLALLYRRIDQVVKDMSILGGDFRPGLEDDIIGELAEVLDVKAVLDKAVGSNIHRTSEDIEDALQRAKEAVEMQQELLKFASGYNPEETKGELKISIEHVWSFLMGMFDFINISITETIYRGKVLKIYLPEHIVDRVGCQRRYMRITCDRDLAARRKDIFMMDMESPLFRYLLDYARSYSFDGRVAGITQFKNADAVFTAMLRWQNDQGTRMRREYVACLVGKNGKACLNPAEFIEWLRTPAMSAENICIQDKENAQSIFEIAKKVMDGRLAEVSNVDLHPENRQVVTACWIAP